MKNEVVSAEDTVSLSAEYFQLLLRAFWVQIPCWVQILTQNSLI